MAQAAAFACLPRLGLRRLSALAGIAIFAGMAAGCTTENGPTAATGTAKAAPSGPPVAFESIDGPPPWIFERLVANLDGESRARNLAVVSRETPNGVYRVRGYMAATIRKDTTYIAWVWDIYDPTDHRAVRIAGEEPGGRPGTDPWTAANEQILRKIAQAGIEGLTTLAKAPAAAEPPRQQEGPAIAMASPPALAFATAGSAAPSLALVAR